MSNVRPIPVSYYYSGQGRLLIGERDTTTGEAKNMLAVGNVTSLTIDIATTKFEHKESMSGLRATDLTIIQEQTATFAFTAESLLLDVLAQGLYGSQAGVTGAAVTNELHMAKRGYMIPLLHPNVSGITIETVSGATPLVDGTDYDYDAGFGTIYIRSDSPVVDPGEGEQVSIDYTYGNYDRLDAFTTGTPPERFLRFEGLNTVNGDLRLIDIFRGSFDPITGLEFINEELGSAEFNGTILPDSTKTSGSTYFWERRVTGPSATSAPPVVSSLSIEDANDDELVLTMSQPLTGSDPSGAGGFIVAATGAAVTVTGVNMTDGSPSVALALSRAIAAGEQVWLSYTPPMSNPLGNANGSTAAFSGRNVQNNVAE